MEFERALFRVYDRTLESLRADHPCLERYCGNELKPSIVCRLVEHVLLLFATLSLALLFVAHSSYVGDAAPLCLVNELNAYHSLLPQNFSSSVLGKNDILQIRIQSSGSLLDRDLSNANISSISDKDFSPDFMFTLNPPLLYLKDGFLRTHSVRMVNLSLTPDCLTRGSKSSLKTTTSILGYDTIMMNQVLRAIPKGGMLKNVATKESWSWTSDFIETYRDTGPLHGLNLRFKILFSTCVAFFFTGTVTAIIVRMLISSGVVIMFPMFLCIRRMGVNVDMQILALSYPWLGIPVEILRRQNKPISSLIMAHFIRVVVLYSMYEACQIAWALWLYDKPLPEGLQLEVYALIMIWEYYSMIYLRSAAAIFYLPKFTFIYFAFFHFYFYGNKYGFFGVALLTMACLMAHSLIFSINHFEVPASARLEVTPEQPRAFFTELPWPAWQASLPPSWTLFMELNSRQRNIYEEDGQALGQGATGTPAEQRADEADDPPLLRRRQRDDAEDDPSEPEGDVETGSLLSDHNR